MRTAVAAAAPDLAELVQATASGRRRRRWVIAAALGLVALAWLSWRSLRTDAGSVPSYVTTLLTRGDLSLVVTATGNLEPTNKVTVGSELSGIVLEVLVQTNDRVTKGQPLARLDTRKLTQQIASSQAGLAAARAKVAQVQATLIEKEAAFARASELQRLGGGRALSKSDMEIALATAARARADFQAAGASVEEAKAQLKAIQTDLEKATIVAPIDGVVLQRKVEPGQTVAANFTAPELFVLAENLERMKLKVSVAEADISGVKEGQSASFTVDAWPERSFTAKVTKAAFGSTVISNVVTYETELEVSNADLSLRPGMTATVDIRTAEARGVWLVPPSALRFEPKTASAASAAEPQKSFLQRIMPGPPPQGGRPPAESEPSAKAGTKAAEPRLWTLRAGQPTPIRVEVGLGNGRFTEVSGKDLHEGLPVIVSQAAPGKP